MHHAVRISPEQFAIADVRQRYNLAVGNVLRAVGKRFIYTERAEACLAAHALLGVVGEQRIACSLECLQLIGQQHAVADVLECRSIGTVTELCHFVVETGSDAQRHLFPCEGHFLGDVAILVVEAQRLRAAIHIHREPCKRYVQQSESGAVAVFQLAEVKNGGSGSHWSHDALRQGVLCPQQVLGRHCAQLQSTLARSPSLLHRFVVPLPDGFQCLLCEVVVAVVWSMRLNHGSRCRFCPCLGRASEVSLNAEVWPSVVPCHR